MEIRKETCTHVHKRAIVDTVGDNTNSPVRDSGDSRLFLAGRFDYSCLQITLDRRRCGHAACYDKQPEDDLFEDNRLTIVKPSIQGFLRLPQLVQAFAINKPEKLADSQPEE